MTVELRESDSQILLQIIQSANQRYLRESRVNRKSSFNILRNCDQFIYQGRKEQVYNWIMYLTKHYNPQTYQQWVNAVRDISNISKKSSRSITHINNNNISHHFSNPNQSHTNNFNQSSLNFSHTNTNTHKTINQFCNDIYDTNDENQFECYPNVSQQYNQSYTQVQSYADYHHNSSTLPKLPQKQFMIRNHHRPRQVISRQNSATNIMAPISSKMNHYISFEPDQENKQNINSSNDPSENLKDNLKSKNNQIKTPCQKSFIHNLPMSYGSTFVFSKVTNNTKDVSQDQGQMTQQWVNMKSRADIFRKINLRFKGFSALLANFQAFEVFQQLNKKTTDFQSVLYYSRFIKNFQRYKIFKREKQEYIKKAQKYYQSKLQKKSFKILLIFYQLKISTTKAIKPLILQKLNYFGYQFLISTIFTPSKQQNQVQFYDRDTPKSIRNKCRHFQNIEDCQKMEIISQYFLNNLKLSKQQIAHLFLLYNNAKKRKIFSILLKNTRKFEKQIQFIRQIKKKGALLDLIHFSKTKVANQTKIQLMKTIKDKKLKQICFHGLFSFQFSKKVYSKRYQFLSKQHEQLTKRNLMRIWRNALSQKNKKKLSYNSRIQKGLQLIFLTIKDKYFSVINQYSKRRKQKQQQLERQKNRQICKQIFYFLKQRVIHRKNYNIMQSRYAEKLKKYVFKTWQMFTNVRTGTEKITNVYKKMSFNTLKQQTTFLLNNQKLLHYCKIQLYYQGMKHFRICYNLDKQQQQNKIDILLRYIRAQQLGIFVNISRFEIKKKNVEVQNKILKDKECRLQQSYSLTQKKYFFQSLRLCCLNQSILRKKNSIIKSVMGDRRILTKNEQIQNQQTQNLPLQIHSTFTRSHKSMKKQGINQLKNNLIFCNQTRKLQSILKQNKSRQIIIQLKLWRKASQYKQKQKSICQKKNRYLKSSIFEIFKVKTEQLKNRTMIASKKYQNSLKFKILLGFAHSVLQTDNKLGIFKKKIAQQRKQSTFRKFTKQLENEIDFKKKQELTRKKVFINAISKCYGKLHEINQKFQKVVKLRRLFSIKSMSNFAVCMNQKRVAEKNQSEAFKRFAIMKINFAVIRNIIKNKQRYMATKFKAIRLCKLAFKGLMVNLLKSRVKPLAQSKTFRAHEHISTEYSSL